MTWAFHYDDYYFSGFSFFMENLFHESQMGPSWTHHPLRQAAICCSPNFNRFYLPNSIRVWMEIVLCRNNCNDMKLEKNKLLLIVFSELKIDFSEKLILKSHLWQPLDIEGFWGWFAKTSLNRNCITYHFSSAPSILISGMFGVFLLR